MKDRIKQLIQREGLNQAQFALRVNIQSSTLSHALSGRNEVSKDIILKIHQAYPAVSINWLMFGEGDMYATAPDRQPPSGNSRESDLFAALHQTTASVSAPPVVERPIAETEITATIQPKQEVVPPPPARRVTKIMVFYSDNTFETFSSDI